MRWTALGTCGGQRETELEQPGNLEGGAFHRQGEPKTASSVQSLLTSGALLEHVWVCVHACALEGRGAAMEGCANG